jgi:hypothetical protein
MLFASRKQLSSSRARLQLGFLFEGTSLGLLINSFEMPSQYPSRPLRDPCAVAFEVVNSFDQSLYPGAVLQCGSVPKQHVVLGDLRHGQCSLLAAAFVCGSLPC